MQGVWAGDKDVGNGLLQALFESYKARCMFVKSIGSKGRSHLVQTDVWRLLSELDNDLEFLTAGAQVANEVYNKALEGSPILLSRFHGKKGSYESFDSTNGECY